MTVDKNILIKNLEDFKDTKKYSFKQLAEFLNKNTVTSDFYRNHVEKFKSYLQKYPRTIIKYSKEYHKFLHLSYSGEEIKLIKKIEEEHLVTFWIIDLVKDGLDVLICHGSKLRFAIKTIDSEESIPDLIDYVIKFCIIPYSESKTPDIVLTETERTILGYLHKGLSVPQIAEKMTCSKNTIENHKKNICKKIDDLDLDEYRDKKALAKLHLLAQKIFK